MNANDLPQKWDLYNFTGLPYFKDWDEGAQANATYNQKKKELNTLKKVLKWSSTAGAVLGSYLALSNLMDNHSVLWFGIILIIAAYLIRKNGPIVRIFVNEKLDSALADWQAVLDRHTDMFIKQLTDKLMGQNWYSYRMGRKCLIYNNERCVYFDAYDRTLVAYNKSNIKDVTRERLHVGSSSSGGASTAGAAYTFDNGITVGGANTNTYSKTVNQYEWHFDIFTDFLAYPKVSLVLNDSQSVEDFVGQAYAILKP